MKIVLVCAGGMSTSILVQNMQMEAKNRNIECDITAIAVSRTKELAKDADVILCAPQVKYQLKSLREQLPSVIIEVIDMIDYGMMDGIKVLDFSLSLVK